MDSAPISAQPGQPLVRRRLRAALLADMETELVLCERVGVLLAAGYVRHEIVRLLGVPPPAVDRARRVLKRACKRLEVD